MNNIKQKEFIVMHESLVSSVLSDAWTFGMIGALAWFNYHFIGGSYFVNTLIVIMMIVCSMGAIKQGRKITNREEAIKVIDSIYPEKKA